MLAAGELPHEGGPGGQSVGRQLLEVSTIQFWTEVPGAGLALLQEGTRKGKRNEMEKH